MGDVDVYIVSACRTGIGSFKGQYSKIPVKVLGSTVIKECLERAGVPASRISEVIMGNVLTAAQGQNPARQASIEANIPNEVPAYLVNMLCGSGLKTVQIGTNSIRNGDSEFVICGGQENMTLAPHAANLRAVKLGEVGFVDTMLFDGLTDAFDRKLMGNTVEFLANKYGVSREEQDKFAYESQMKASKAVSQGYFNSEIVPVKGITSDEFVKSDVTLEQLAKLKPAFDTKGSVTAGNSSGINDGAAAVLLCGKKQLEENNLKALAKILGFSTSGLEPIEMGIAPIVSIQKLLKKVNWNKEDVDLFEINEAFAAQSVIILDKLGLDKKRVNVTGGAIALGHPIGASGTRVLVTLIYNLKRLGLKKGVASLCIGGGMGIAIAIEIV